MPAYFSMVFEIKKDNKYDALFEDFIEVLEREGFVFKSGYLGFENESLEEIIKWNTEKLKADYETGYDEHFSNDYRHICWNYHDLSEVRLFIVNSKKENYFSIYIIIPESDFIYYHGGITDYDPKIIEGLIKTVCKIWELGFIDNIQTELELSEGALDPEDLEKGEMPSTKPFAVISEALYDSGMDEIYSKKSIGRKGLLLGERREEHFR